MWVKRRKEKDGLTIERKARLYPSQKKIQPGLLSYQAPVFEITGSLNLDLGPS